MKRHVWSSKETALLKKNVEQYGLTAGCKKTAEKLNLTHQQCYSRIVYKKINSDYDNIGKRYNPNLENKIAKYLEKHIPDNPNNLKVVFESCAEKFGLTCASIMNRWYGMKLKSKKGVVITDYSKYPSYRGNMQPLFGLIGNNSVVNGKNQNKCTVKKTGFLMVMFKKLVQKINW